MYIFHEFYPGLDILRDLCTNNDNIYNTCLWKLFPNLLSRNKFSGRMRQPQ